MISLQAIALDEAWAALDQALAGILRTADVQSGARVINVRFQNETGGALDPNSGTLRAGVRKPWL